MSKIEPIHVDDTTKRTDPRFPDDAVWSEGRFSLIRMPHWNKFNDHQEDLIAIHDCDQTGQKPFFVAMPICDPCNFCGRVAPEKIQTLMVLHNGHY